MLYKATETAHNEAVELIGLGDRNSFPQKEGSVFCISTPGKLLYGYASTETLPHPPLSPLIPGIISLYGVPCHNVTMGYLLVSFLLSENRSIPVQYRMAAKHGSLICIRLPYTPGTSLRLAACSSSRPGSLSRYRVRRGHFPLP
jgi:hypothetical protein